MVHTITSNNGQNDVHVDNTFVESYHVVRTVYDKLDELTSLANNNDINSATRFYDTYALALADIANIPLDAIIEVLIDETQNNNRTVYKKTEDSLLVKLVDNVVDKLFIPSSQISTPNFGATYLREFVEHKLYLNMLNPILDGTVNVGTRLQELINKACTTTRIGSREVVISGRGTSKLARVFNTLVIPNNANGLKIICDDETALLSGGTTLTSNGGPSAMAMFSMRGTHPDTISYTNWLMLTQNAYKNSDRITISNTASFAIGDLVALKNDYIIDTSPNRFNLRQEQPCLIIRIEGNTLIFSDPLIYDFLIDNTHNSRVQKYTNVRKNVTFENIKVGKFGFDTFNGNIVKQGRSLESRFSANLRLKNCNFENGRAYASDDLVGTSSLTLSGDYRPIITDLTTKYSRAYGIEINGSCYETLIKNHVDYFSRHPISLNWSGNNGVVFGNPVTIPTDDPINPYKYREALYHTTGEPINTRVYGLTAYNSTKSGFDSHDVGIGTYVQDLVVIGAGNLSNYDPVTQKFYTNAGVQTGDANVGSGIQCRTGDMHFHNVHIEGCSDFGIRTNTSTKVSRTLRRQKVKTKLLETDPDVYIEDELDMPFERKGNFLPIKITGKCVVKDCGRGAVTSNAPIYADELHLENNCFPKYYLSGSVACLLIGGHIKKLTAINNKGAVIGLGNNSSYTRAMEKLIIDNIYAPANENQTEFVREHNPSGNNYSYEFLELKNTIDITGYDPLKLFTSFKENSDIDKMNLVNVRIGKDKLYGQFQLTSGEAFILNDNVIEPVYPYRNKIFLEPEILTETNFFPSSRFENVALGLLNNPLSNYPLPQYWGRGGAGITPLNFEITEISSNQLEFPYIDIRVYGTSATTNFVIYFGVANTIYADDLDDAQAINNKLDSRAFTEEDDEWRFKLNLSLISGSMTNVTNIRQHLTVYSDQLTESANEDYDEDLAIELGDEYTVPRYIYSPVSISSAVIDNSFIVTSTDTTFTNDFTMTDPDSFKIRTGLQFNMNSGTAIDFKIRISKPELLKLNEILPTGNGNLRITKKFHNVGFKVTSYDDSNDIDTTDNRKINYFIK